MKGTNNPRAAEFSATQRAAFRRETYELIDRLTFKVKRDPQAFDDFILLGSLYRISGDAKKALQLHRNLLVRPSLEREVQISLFVELGYDTLALRIQDYGESFFLRALDLQRNNIPALEGLATSYECREHFEQAAPTVQRLLKNGRDESTRLSFIFAALAQQYLKRDDLTKARRAVNKALKADPKSLYGKLMLADVYMAAKRWTKALEVLKELIRDWPHFSFLFLRRMEDVHFQMNMFPAYENTLLECLREAPENVHLHHSLARHLVKKKRNAEAFLPLARALTLHPLHVNALKDRFEIHPSSPDVADLKKFAKAFFELLKESRRFICPNCKEHYDDTRWRCTVCDSWGVFDVRYEFPTP